MKQGTSNLFLLLGVLPEMGFGTAFVISPTSRSETNADTRATLVTLRTLC